MGLTLNQKKYINKNIKKNSVGQIAKSIQISKEEVIKYLKDETISVDLVLHKPLIKKAEQLTISKDRSTKKSIWHITALISLIFIVYINSLNNGFVSDDIMGIVNNAEIGNIGKIFKEPFIMVQNFIYFIIFNLFGRNPFVFRFLNILFHVGTVLTVFFFILSTSGYFIAFITASFLAVHPIAIESIGWISGGTYVRYSFFFLLSLFFYTKINQNKKYFWWSIIASILALLSSEKAIILPLLFFLYEAVFGNIKENWKKLSAYFAISGIWVLFYLSQIGNRISGLTTTSYSQTKLLNPLVQIPVAIVTYLQLIFWPDKLTLYHSELTFTTVQFGLRVLGFLGFLGMLGWAWKKNKQIFFWLLFFIISLLPTLTPLGISWIVAERYVYLGSIGVLFVIGYLLAGLIKNEKTKVIGYLLFVICLLGLMTRIIVRNMDWKNEDSLWLSMKDISTADPKTHNNLGDMYGRHGDLKKAEEEFKKAIAINPNYGDAYHNLANTYLQMKKYDLAIENYQRALKTNPNLWQSYQNIAAIYYEQKNYSQAVLYMEKATSINSQDDNLFLNLGVAYLQIKEVAKAKQSLEKALSLNPQNAKAKELLLLISNPTTITPAK